MKKHALSLLAATITTPALADVSMSEFSWGVGIAASQDVYTDFDNRIIPVPIISYQGERLSVYGPYVRYKVIQQGNLSVDLNLTPTFAGFNSSDSPIFAGMDDRDFSVSGGAGINYQLDRWRFHANIVHDLLSVYEGYQGSTGVSYRVPFDDFALEGGASLLYWDKNYVDYYYGVKQDEVTSQRAYYKGSDSVNAQLKLGFSTTMLFSGVTRLEFTQTFYGSSIEDSPLTDSDSSFGFNFMFNTHF